MSDSQLEVCRFCEGELSHHSATLDVHMQQSNGKIVSSEHAAKRSSEYERSVKRESNRMCTKTNILPHSAFEFDAGNAYHQVLTGEAKDCYSY